MKKIFSLLLGFVIAQGIYAQSSFVLSYPIGFTMGDLNKYISATSFRGISMEFNRRIKPNVEVGVEVGWNVFYEKVSAKTYTSGSASITGVQYRYANIVPMIAGAKWYLNSKGKGQPYLGAGIGVLYAENSTDFGLYRISTDGWPFCIRPEAGVTFELHQGLSALLGVKYYSAFKTDDLDSESFLTINIGFVFHH